MDKVYQNVICVKIELIENSLNKNITYYTNDLTQCEHAIIIFGLILVLILAFLKNYYHMTDYLGKISEKKLKHPTRQFSVVILLR